MLTTLLREWRAAFDTGARAAKVLILGDHRGRNGAGADTASMAVRWRRYRQQPGSAEPGRATTNQCRHRSETYCKMDL